MTTDLLLTLASLLGGALLGASAAVALRGLAGTAQPDHAARRDGGTPSGVGVALAAVRPAAAAVVAPRPLLRAISPALMSTADQGRLEALRNRRNAEAASGAAYGPASDAHVEELKRLARAEVPVAWRSEWTLWHAGISCGDVLVFWGTDRHWHAGISGGDSVLAGGGVWCGAPRLRDALHLLAEQSPEAAEAVLALGVSVE